MPCRVDAFESILLSPGMGQRLVLFGIRYQYLWEGESIQTSEIAWEGELQNFRRSKLRVVCLALRKANRSGPAFRMKLIHIMTFSAIEHGVELFIRLQRRLNLNREWV